MADYSFLLDADWFEGRARPDLAEARRRRSFEPCHDLCVSLLPAARDYAAKYHVGGAEPLLVPVAGGLAFDYATWRGLVSEILLYGAVEIPELQNCAETLVCLLAPDRNGQSAAQRQNLAPIQQAHVGTRDLIFGSAVYRPEHAGYNHAADVARLAAYLGSIQPQSWTVADLAPLQDLSEEEKQDELIFAQEWFPVLAELFQRAHRDRRVIVHESIY